MKMLLTVLSASAILSTLAFAESATSTAVQATHQMTEQEQVKNMTQNRFKNMNTDELLEKRGTMTNQQDRDQLHNELMSREKTMTKEQKESFNQRPPANRTPKMKNQGQGGGMGSGKGR